MGRRVEASTRDATTSRCVDAAPSQSHIHHYDCKRTSKTTSTSTMSVLKITIIQCSRRPQDAPRHHKTSQDAKTTPNRPPKGEERGERRRGKLIQPGRMSTSKTDGLIQPGRIREEAPKTRPRRPPRHPPRRHKTSQDAPKTPQVLTQLIT